MNKSILKMLVSAVILAIICAGCASADGGAVVGGILQGLSAAA